MKLYIKNKLKNTSLLEWLQWINYRSSFLNPKSKHPRKLVVKFYSQFVKRHSLVFDIGANKGERVAIFSELGAIVIAVDPLISAIMGMKDRFRNHKNIIFENVGLDRIQGEMPFYICDEDDRLSTFSPEQMKSSFFANITTWNRQEIIMVCKLDDLIIKYGIPDFCKIDVEGYELNVLQGLSLLIPALSFEFSSKQIEIVCKCFEVLNAMSDRYVFNVCFGEPYNLYFKEWVNKELVLDEIRRKDSLAMTHAWGDIYAKLV